MALKKKKIEKRVSPLGLLLNRLDIPVGFLARHLYVDSSLVSKWKNGTRRLSERSDHFEGVLDFFSGKNNDDFSFDLRSRVVGILKELNPLESIDSEEDVRRNLQIFLLERSCAPLVPLALESTRAVCVAKVLIYEGLQGRRDAVSELMDLAEAMTSPGSMILTESEQFQWLLEDPNYARVWQERLYRLLERGFRATFIVHFTVYQEQFFQFFKLCSPLLFHRNVEWYYHEYYDEDIRWFSFFILEHARSIMSLFMGAGQYGTSVFTDIRSIVQHKRFVETVNRSSRPLFMKFPKGRLLPSLGELLNSNWQKGAMFSFLPVPMFAAMGPELVEEVLRDNGVRPARIRRCLRENHLLEEIVNRQTRPEGTGGIKMINVYQLEEMRRRMDEGGFMSCSLTLMAGCPVYVTREQYGRGLRDVVHALNSNPNLEVVLASEEDHNQLPGLNTWCKGAEWMVQMDFQGVRFCREDVMVRAASAALERCLRKIPPARKQQALVKQMLLEMAEELLGKE